MGFKNDQDFDPDGYVKVNERIAEFREQFSDGFISTFKSKDETGITFKAVVCRNADEAKMFTETGVAAATGHSFLSNEEDEKKAQEYAETVSVGRALAMLGFGVEKAIASAEEMSKFKNKVDKKVETKKEEPKVAAKKVVKFASKAKTTEETKETKTPEKVDRLKVTGKFTKGAKFSKS